MKKYLSIWAIIWALVTLVIIFLGYQDALGGIALAALISLFFLFKTLYSAWSGTVTDIKTENVYVSDDDGGYTRSAEFAYIKLDNGKNKKTANLGWKVGDKLEKVRGETSVKTIK